MHAPTAVMLSSLKSSSHAPALRASTAHPRRPDTCCLRPKRPALRGHFYFRFAIFSLRARVPMDANDTKGGITMRHINMIILMTLNSLLVTACSNCVHTKDTVQPTTVSTTQPPNSPVSVWGNVDNVYYFIDANLPPDIATPAFIEDVRSSFDDLNAATCEGTPTFVYAGKINARLNQDDGCEIPVPGAIFITVRWQSWDGNDDYLGVAHICQLTESKRRLGVGIAINYALYLFSPPGQEPTPGSTRFSLRRLLTHEAGHAVGLPHHTHLSQENVMNMYLARDLPYDGLSIADQHAICPGKPVHVRLAAVKVQASTSTSTVPRRRRSPPPRVYIQP